MLVLAVFAVSIILSINAECTGNGSSKVDVVLRIQDDRCGQQNRDGGVPAPVYTKECRKGWLYYAGSCYGFADVKQNWQAAASLCAVHGSYLVEVNNADENTWIVNQLRTRQFGGVWIGAMKALQRETWEWAHSGDPFDYSDWTPGQPHQPPGILEDCMEIRKEFDYRWNDWECQFQNRYICETKPKIRSFDLQ